MSEKKEIQLNPGHTQGLRELGILEEGETSLDPNVLIERTINKGKVEEVTSLLMQETSNRLSVLQDLDEFIKDSDQQIKKGDKEMIAENAEVIERTLELSTVQLSQIVQVVNSEAFKQNCSTNKFTKYTNRINETADKTKEILEEKGEYYLNNLSRFRAFLGLDE